jgi:hypothetical protein
VAVPAAPLDDEPLFLALAIGLLDRTGTAIRAGAAMLRSVIETSDGPLLGF